MPDNIVDEKLTIIKVYDFNQICRSCLREGSLTGIFELIYEEDPFVDILLKLFGTRVNLDDHLPTNICERCIGEIINFYDFLKIYKNSEATLLSFITSSNFIEPKGELQDFEEKHVELENSEYRIKLEGNEKILPERQINQTEFHPSVESDNTIAIVSNKSKYREDYFSTIQYQHKAKVCNKTKPDPKTYTCTCNETFTCRMEFIKHKKEQNHDDPKTQNCKVCSKIISRRGMSKHMRSMHSDKDPAYVCEICGITCKSKGNITKHNMRHTGERPHLCDICGKGFIQKHGLIDHRKVHTGERPYSCTQCGGTFITKQRYTVHLLAIHKNLVSTLPTGKKAMNKAKENTRCKICNKVYSTKMTLKAHMNRHGEKNFLCTQCGKSFFTQSALLSHSIVHTAERKYFCEVCGKSFKRFLIFRRHQYIHSGVKPYTCKVCQKSFRQEAHLATHSRTHTGEKPYACRFCDKTFAHTMTRIIHERLHTGERPYVCDVCSKGFHHSSSMTKHRQRHFNKTTVKLEDDET